MSRFLIRPEGQFGLNAWSKAFHPVYWYSSSTQPIFIKNLKGVDTKQDGCLTEINGYSSDLRSGKIGSSVYLLPEYTHDPDEALTNIEFKKFWGAQKELGSPLIKRPFIKKDIYMIQDKRKDIKNKITEVALWKATVLNPWSELEGKNWPGRSNDIDQDLQYLYVLWRTDNPY